MLLSHWQLSEYLSDDDLPLYLRYVAPKEHPDLDFHDHNTSEIVFVLSGEADHIVQTAEKHSAAPTRNHVAHIQTGDVLVIHPGCFHAYDRAETLELFNVVYDRKKLVLPLLDGYSMPLFHILFPREELRTHEKSVMPVMKLDSAEMTSIQPMLNEMLLTMTAHRPGVFFDLLGMFMRVISMLGKMRLDEEPAPRPSRYQIADALLLMAQKYASHISLDELAKSVNMSRRNFCRQFHQTTGTSPGLYLQKLRIDRAIELLQTTNLEIGTIAMQCGFCDSNYFCKQFRQICHKTPSAFRRELNR